MDRSSRLAALTLMSSVILASCGGGDGESTSSGPTEDARVSASAATVAQNTMCSVSTLGSYYWEIGNANGVLASGSVGAGAPTATTSMWVFSSSKWLYAANVVQKHGVLDSDVPYLNFTSGYSEFGNAPVCTGSTVDECLVGRDGQDPTTIGRFDYDSGHMEKHASAVMGLGGADNAALAADLNATIGNYGFSYTVQQLAAGVVVTPQGYAQFLRAMLRGELKLAAALGTHKVCANTATPGCNAAFSPDDLPPTEAWNYSLGHWVEDDPVVGDHAFSSAGGGGFYPWIDATKTYYGIIARVRETESGAGVHSEQCGRLVRQAWTTGVTVTATEPTPAGS